MTSVTAALPVAAHGHRAAFGDAGDDWPRLVEVLPDQLPLPVHEFFITPFQGLVTNPFGSEVQILDLPDRVLVMAWASDRG
jgi:hypothetical protein